MRFRRFAVYVALVTSVAVLTSGSPAAAAPADEEGGTASLREQLDSASRGFLDAKGKLTASQKRQKQLKEQLKKIESELVDRTETVGELASVAYRTGRLAPMSALLSSDGPTGFLDRASMLETVAAGEDKQVRALVTTRDTATRAKTSIDAEVKEQEKQLEVMKKRKTQAENALKAVGSGGATSTVSGTGSAATAASAPRASDGSFAAQSCNQNDPTTTGCITARTLHAMNQAKAAGFTRFVSCFRSGGGGEHPKGRACDFAAQSGGFGGTATGGDRTYGDNLAAFFVKNADRLGVLYVIWFRRIWLPSSGWRAYNGDGTPSGDHTNHNHLSVV